MVVEEEKGEEKEEKGSYGHNGLGESGGEGNGASAGGEGHADDNRQQHRVVHGGTYQQHKTLALKTVHNIIL